MDKRQIKLDSEDVLVPSYYQQVESMPEDPEGSIPLMAQSDNAVCFVMLQEIARDEAMPFDDPQSVIDGIHECLREEQGLIEVEAGGQDGDRYIYSIVKTLKNPDIPEGVQYALTLDKECDNGVVHAQGFFDEQGTTGLRDTMIFQMLASENGFDETSAAWTRDPYDPTYERGLLMNQSEGAVFDRMFASHPLSMAREFVSCAISSVDDLATLNVAGAVLEKIENAYVLDLKEGEVEILDINAVERTPSDMDGLDMAWCLLTATVSTFITTSESFAKWLEGVHDAASEKSGNYGVVQSILGKTLHHKGDWMDNFKARDGQNAYAIFHRLLGGHDIFARGQSLTPHNPFAMMIEQEGSAIGGVLQATRHLVADTFSKQGLPVPFSSYLDIPTDAGRPWNKIIDIVQELSVESTGSKKQAEAIYSHMFTLRAQDFAGGGAALALTSAYIKARGIEDAIRKTQIKLVAYSLSFFAQAALGAAKQNGVPYINYAVGAAMAKELVSLFVESNRRTYLLGKETARLHEGAQEQISRHESLKGLL